MRVCDFKKIKKEKTPQQIIGLHTHEKIKLTPRQLNELLESKKEIKRHNEIDAKRKRRIKLRIRLNTLIMKLKGELND